MKLLFTVTGSTDYLPLCGFGLSTQIYLFQKCVIVCMTFEQKYTDDAFLQAIPYIIPKSIAAIVNEIGCGKNTAKRYLSKLEQANKIKRCMIEGSIHFGYVRVSQEIMLEGVVGADGVIRVDSSLEGSKYKLTVYKEQVPPC